MVKCIYEKFIFFIFNFCFFLSCTRDHSPGQEISVKSEKKVAKEFEVFSVMLSSYQQTLDSVLSVINLESLKKASGSIKVHIRISEEGKIIFKEIMESCGNSRIDNTVLNTLQTLQPFNFAVGEVRKVLEKQGMVFSFSLKNKKLNFVGADTFKNNGDENKKTQEIYVREIDKTVNAHLSEILPCIEQAKIRNRHVEGKIYFSWKVFHGGVAVEVKEIENKTGDKVLSQCLISFLRKLKFTSPPNGEQVEVERYFFDVLKNREKFPQVLL